MTAFAELVLKLALAGIVGTLVVLAVVFIFDIAAKWALGREQARQTWHVANPADVARTQADNDAAAELGLIIDDLDEALAGVRA